MPQAIWIRLTGVLFFYCIISTFYLFYTMIPDKEALPLNKLSVAFSSDVKSILN
jgi:hypothetical protein